MMRQLFSTLLALALICVPFALTPNTSQAAAHGGLWDEIQGHGGEILNIVAHGDHIALNHSLDTIQSTAERFSNDPEVARLLSRMSELNAGYESALAAPEDALMDTSVPEHYGVVHPMHNMAAALTVRLTGIAPRNSSVIAMNSELRLNKMLHGTDAQCGIESVSANGTLLSDSFWDMVDNAPTETHMDSLQDLPPNDFLLGLFALLVALAGIAWVTRNQTRSVWHA